MHMRYRLVVQVTAADIGQRVAIRWRPAELEGRSTWMTDVLGILEDANDQVFKVRRGRDGQLIVIPRTPAVAGKAVPPKPPARSRRGADRAGRIPAGDHGAEHGGGEISREEYRQGKVEPED